MPRKKKSVEEQAVNAAVALDEINQIEQATKAMEQEDLNKSHDTEFTQYSDVNGIAPEVTNLNVITDKEIKEAEETLMKYKQNKAELERKLERNEDFWKLNHWKYVESAAESKRIKPTSAWLVNEIINKHADMMDNFPEPNILPRSKDDEQAAKLLSEIIPVILEQNDFEETYSNMAWDKNKNGAACVGVFWNNDKDNGLGNVDIKPIDLLKIYWKSGCTDIQDSPNVFVVNMMENDEIKARYPDIKEPNSTTAITAADLYHYGEDVDTSDQSPVIDWYYKRRVSGVDSMGVPQMKTILHYCKFCNGQVIYASENDPNFADTGWYAHGMYPFVFDNLYPIKSNLVGMGFIDLNGDDQIYVDKMQQAFMENTIVSARPRYAVRNDSGLNEEEFMDIDNPLVHFDGNLGEDAYRQIVSSPIPNIYMNIWLQKIQEMKDTSGNTAASQGQVSQVTTASGIASLQEAAGKLSRTSSKASYRAFKKIVNLVIEVIRQFYTEPRCFRIVGEMGQVSYETFDNSLLQPQAQGNDFGLDLGSRLPILDIDVKPQKKSAYTKETQNQTALNLYNMQFFNPANSQASLACLNMMDFDGIEDVKGTVAANGYMYQQMMMLQTQAGMQTQSSQEGGASIDTSRGSLSSQAASATRESTSPR